MHRTHPPLAALLSLACCGAAAAAEFHLVRDGRPLCDVHVDAANCRGEGAATLQDAGRWLIDGVARSSGAALPIVEQPGERPCVVVARADAYPQIARQAGLDSPDYDAFCVAVGDDRLHVLGNSEAAARHGVVTLLRDWGFRWFAPSPHWHLTPRLEDVVVDRGFADRPQLAHRGIWYAYAGGEKELMENYRRWAIANRLSVSSVIRTGHSYGNIVGRNEQAFEEHPEYYALLPDGTRDNRRPVNARKFCYSNPGLLDLVARDRERLLASYREANPAAYMVSVDPSDGQGTCHCKDCDKLGTPTDRVLHLANHTARHLRQQDPGAWVGLYAYSSHRLPPTIDVEPNVYVQVAMAFNRTEYSLPELVERWSQKVGAIGLREYYGVEAWDWGLPGRMRGGQVAYHRRWIPFYAERKLNAVNAETNANWGGQALGLHVAAALMWDPAADVDALVDDFFQRCYGPAGEPMRRLAEKFDQAPPLRAATLAPMFRDVREAWKIARSAAAGGPPQARRRIVDMKAYLVYVAKFREFDLVRGRRPGRDQQYYEALRPLMEYAWRIRMRDVVHSYALARRLCNGLPVRDQRLDFYMFNKEQAPVWRTGDQLTDGQILAAFQSQLERLQEDGDPVVSYSRYLEPLRGQPAAGGPSRQFLQPEEGVAVFRHQLTGYLVPAGRQVVRLDAAPTGRAARVTVYLRGDEVLFEKELKETDEFQRLEFELPKANEYRVEIRGGVKLRAGADVPLVFEASAASPAWIDYSGPHYFYVPRGATELLVDANPRLSVHVPGRKQRIDITPASRLPGKDYAVIPVPPEAAGKVWRTSDQTRGQVSLMNVPPLLSLHPQTLHVPREVAESDGLTTRQ